MMINQNEGDKTGKESVTLIQQSNCPLTERQCHLPSRDLGKIHHEISGAEHPQGQPPSSALRAPSHSRCRSWTSKGSAPACSL
jgi:hypothetical protein